MHIIFPEYIWWEWERRVFSGLLKKNEELKVGGTLSDIIKDARGSDEKPE